MNRRQIHRQFGKRPSLESVLVWAVQQALKGYRGKHPDSKRTQRAKLEARMRKERKSP